MNTRTQILDKIKRSLSGEENEDTRRSAVKRHLKRHPVGTLPTKISSTESIIKHFMKKAKLADATAERCHASDVTERIAFFLRKHNLPAACRMGTDSRLGKLVSTQTNLLDVSYGPSKGNDLTALSCALGGVAETGTLVIVSGPENPTSLNFLPENHIVVVREKDIHAHQEDLWKKIRKKYGSGNMPRTVNMITGPSRSADIEQTLILGAHGPLRLHILVVKD